MLLAKILTVHIIKYWSLGFVPLAFLFFVLPCRFRIRDQARWLMFLLLCGMKGIVYETFGGNALAPDLPEPVLWLWNWGDDGLFFLVALSLVWWVRKGRAWLLPLLAWGIAAWGQYEGTRVPDVREVELRFANLPASLNGYRLVQVSDLHCSNAARGWRTRAIVDRVNAQNADLVCLTGDYVDGTVDSLSDDLLPLKDLKARDGVYAVRGNHEYYVDRIAWQNWFAEKGPRLLVNECVFPHAGLVLAGVNDDTAARKHGDVPANVQQAFTAATNGEFRILLDHRPVNAPVNLVKHRVDLQLSGHTHGGIAWLIDRLVAAHNNGYVRGVYRMDGRALYVSSGCGQWAGFPMRFFTPSEITVLTLKRR